MNGQQQQVRPDQQQPQQGLNGPPLGLNNGNLNNGGNIQQSQQPQADLSNSAGANHPFGNLDGGSDFPMNMDFGNLDGPDVLDNFDFDSFLNQENEGLSFDAAGFGVDGFGLEATAGDLGGS